MPLAHYLYYCAHEYGSSRQHPALTFSDDVGLTSGCTTTLPNSSISRPWSSSRSIRGFVAEGRCAADRGGGGGIAAAAAFAAGCAADAVCAAEGAGAGVAPLAAAFAAFAACKRWFSVCALFARVWHVQVLTAGSWRRVVGCKPDAYT